MFKYALAAATLAATVVANSSSSCPATITSTSQADYPSGVMIRTTVTHEADAETFTTTLPLTTTVTSWVTSGTTTSTAAEATSTLTSCTASTTTGVEYTATEYTGSYSSSSLRQSTSCKPWTTAVYEYPLGTTTWTNTYDVYPTSTVTHFEPSAYGNASQITETVTSSKDHTVTITSAGTTTKTEESYCTTTISDTTGTASSTVTQAAKFARYNPYDGIAYSGEEAPKSYGGDAASKDPSSCCQACQDDEECAGSSWYLSTDRNYNYVPACYLYNMTVGAADTCGLAFSMFPGEKKWMQSGCGYIAENVWDPNSNCLPGQTARECADRGTILG